MKTTEMAIEESIMRFIGDGHHAGTNFYWQERQQAFVVVDLENRKVTLEESLFLVRADSGPDEGLTQACLGCDLEDPKGLYLVNGEFVKSAAEGYLYDVVEVSKR